MPRIQFRPPKQLDNAPGYPRVVRWGVPITLKPAYVLRKCKIENCTVYLFDAGNGGQGYNMKWLERKDDEDVQTCRSITLECGREFIIPIVQRDEGGDGKGYYLNEAFLNNGKGNIRTSPPGSKIGIRLEIRSGKNRWRPKDSYYFLVVPDKGISNSAFRLEQHYGDTY